MPGISRVAFTIFGVDIYWYAIMIVIGMIGGVLTAMYLAKKRDIDPDCILDMVIIVIPVGIVGARLYYMLFDGMPITEFFQFRNGGLAIYGGVIFGAIAAVAVSLVKKLKFPQVLAILDCLFVGAIFGQAIGRWGNFFNQEAHGGLITNMALQWFPMGVLIEKTVVDGVYYTNVWCYATFFYEFLVNIIGWALLGLFNLKKKDKTGCTVCGYLIWYGLGRTFIEGMRTDSLYFLKDVLGETIRVSQVLSLALVIVGIVGFILLWRNSAKLAYEPIYSAEAMKKMKAEAEKAAKAQAENAESGGAEIPAETTEEKTEETADSAEENTKENDEKSEKGEDNE